MFRSKQPRFINRSLGTSAAAIQVLNAATKGKRSGSWSKEILWIKHIRLTSFIQLH